MKTITVSLAAIAIASPALADTIDDTTIVVTASRSGEGVPLDRLGASVTILDADALDKRQTRIVSDILRDVPGVAISRVGAIGSQTQARLRGSEGNHVLVLVDGIEVADPFQGEYDLGTLIADPGARIEVLRGQQSALYGSDAIGGVIHYITATGADEPGVSLRAEGGSFETASAAARVAGVTGDLDYALSGSYYHTGGTPTARGGTRDIGSDNVGASAKLIWSPSSAFTLTGVARYSLTEAENNNTEFDTTSPLFGFIVDSPGAHFRNEGFYGLVEAKFVGLDGRWITTGSAQIADTTRRGFTSFGLDNGDKGRRTKASLTSSIGFGEGSVQHRITGAVDIERERFRNLSPFAFQGARHTDNLGFVGQYELTIDDRFALSGSVRRDENDRFADATTWRAQASYRVFDATRLRGAWGTGVKNPGYFELYGFLDGEYIGNPNLKPEKSKGWEAGIDQTIGDDQATISATWFKARLEDEIFTTFPPPNFIATPDNRTTRSRQEGLELSLAARPFPQLRVDAAYTYLKARENGVVEVRRPKHIASFNATLESADERLSGTLTVRYNGRQGDVAFTDPSFAPVNVTLQEYVLVNLAAEYKLTETIALYGRVENLFDEAYEEVFSYATSGRAAYGGVRVRF